MRPTWRSVRVDGDFVRGRLLRQRRLDQDAQRKQNARLDDSRSAARSPVHRRQRRLRETRREVRASVCAIMPLRVFKGAHVRVRACALPPLPHLEIGRRGLAAGEEGDGNLGGISNAEFELVLTRRHRRVTVDMQLHLLQRGAETGRRPRERRRWGKKRWDV